MSAITSDLCYFLIWIVVIASAVIALAWLTLKKRSQKIDNLLVLATCWSGTSAILKVNAPVVHGTT